MWSILANIRFYVIILAQSIVIHIFYEEFKLILVLTFEGTMYILNDHNSVSIIYRLISMRRLISFTIH